MAKLYIVIEKIKRIDWKSFYLIKGLIFLKITCILPCKITDSLTSWKIINNTLTKILSIKCKNVFLIYIFTYVKSTKINWLSKASFEHIESEYKLKIHT